MPDLIYVQNSGEFFDLSSAERLPLRDSQKQIVLGYSGVGEHKNRPDSESFALGPIPRGRYTIVSRPIGEHPAKYLEPDFANQVHERSGFFILAEGHKTPGWVSAGSIIVDDDNAIESFQRYDSLLVVRTKPLTLAELNNFRKAFLGVPLKAGAFNGRLALDPNLSLGRGFRSFDKKVVTPAIDTSSYTQKASGNSNYSYFGVVADEQSLQKVLTADASVGLVGDDFSVAVKANFQSQFSQQVTSVTVALSKQIVKGNYSLDTNKFPLDSNAKIVAQNAPQNYVLAYGDQIITSVGLGGACCYLLTYYFNTQTEAQTFQGSIGGTYGLFSGKGDDLQSRVSSHTAVSVSLQGYSTGTTDVPKIIQNSSQLNAGSNFLFNPQFSSELINGLLKFFDEFDSHFTGNVEDSAQYSQVTMEGQSITALPYTYFGNDIQIYDKLVNLVIPAIKIGKALDQQDEIIKILHGQLKYMT